MSPDGMTLAVRTYSEIFFYALENSARKAIAGGICSGPAFSARSSHRAKPSTISTRRRWCSARRRHRADEACCTACSANHEMRLNQVERRVSYQRAQRECAGERARTTRSRGRRSHSASAPPEAAIQRCRKAPRRAPDPAGARHSRDRRRAPAAPRARARHRTTERRRAAARSAPPDASAQCQLRQRVPRHARQRLLVRRHRLGRLVLPLMNSTDRVPRVRAALTRVEMAAARLE